MMVVYCYLERQLTGEAALGLPQRIMRGHKTIMETLIDRHCHLQVIFFSSPRFLVPAVVRAVAVSDRGTGCKVLSASTCNGHEIKLSLGLGCLYLLEEERCTRYTISSPEMYRYANLQICIMSSASTCRCLVTF